jgi:hypothetical protein
MRFEKERPYERITRTRSYTRRSLRQTRSIRDRHSPVPSLRGVEIGEANKETTNKSITSSRHNHRNDEMRISTSVKSFFLDEENDKNMVEMRHETQPKSKADEWQTSTNQDREENTQCVALSQLNPSLGLGLGFGISEIDDESEDDVNVVGVGNEGGGTEIESIFLECRSNDEEGMVRLALQERVCSWEKDASKSGSGV